jgi:hypothetical protein
MSPGPGKWQLALLQAIAELDAESPDRSVRLVDHPRALSFSFLGSFLFASRYWPD